MTKQFWIESPAELPSAEGLPAQLLSYVRGHSTTYLAVGEGEARVYLGFVWTRTLRTSDRWVVGRLSATREGDEWVVVDDGNFEVRCGSVGVFRGETGRKFLRNSGVPVDLFTT